MTRDKCGICGGDGTTCRTVKGTYNERGSFGYNAVMKIPAGSANIDIRQHGYNNQKDDDNYLSLRASNGEFLLNGHYQVSVFRQQIPIQDVILEYSGSDNVVERINGTGPIRIDIYVHVLSVGNLLPPDISYEYMTAVDTPLAQSPAISNYHWRLADQWSVCDRVCQGKNLASLYLPMISTKGALFDDAATVLCFLQCAKFSRLNKLFVRSERQRAALMLPQSGSGPCDFFLFFKGTQSQEIICVDSSNNRQASERMCTAQRPQTNTRMCNIECIVKWSTEDVSHCSAQCGSGEKKQRVFCVKVEGNRQTITRDEDCDRAT
ncbi:unnamed protein product [Strongylus vulgaris]|uniref:ADAMTS/ADAMTS-like Spacer 1 domain-containing protein n=1 Tax=Strongylus vulgaris TaxID=40348 RepID=A0A3P7LQZ6_STRVU|nr:unnamed protein product [Strongylus vulgaris]